MKLSLLCYCVVLFASILPIHSIHLASFSQRHWVLSEDVEEEISSCHTIFLSHSPHVEQLIYSTLHDISNPNSSNYGQDYHNNIPLLYEEILNSDKKLSNNQQLILAWLNEQFAGEILHLQPNTAERNHKLAQHERHKAFIKQHNLHNTPVDVYFANNYYDFASAPSASIVHVAAAGDSIDFCTSKAQVDKLFKTKLKKFRLQSNDLTDKFIGEYREKVGDSTAVPCAYRAAQDISIPLHLHSAIDFISGLNTPIHYNRFKKKLNVASSGVELQSGKQEQCGSGLQVIDHVNGNTVIDIKSPQLLNITSVSSTHALSAFFRFISFLTAPCASAVILYRVEEAMES
jgi:hypothetical protein